jgi:hypothetical protein
VERTELNTKQRFDELVVGYVNDALEPQERRWVEEYLRDHPDSQHELAWHHQLKSANDIQDLQIPRDAGLSRLLELVNAEALKPSGSVSGGLFERVWRWFADMNTRPVFAFASLVVLAQAVALGFLMKSINERDQLISEYSTTRAIPGQTRPEAPTLQVTFKSAATEQDIRLLLVGVQARIIDGPKQLGDYTIAVPAGKLDQAKATLEDSAIVEFVSLQEHPR